MIFRSFQNFPSFNLKGLLASHASVDEDDVLNVKQRLNVSGHYEVPSYGMTRYPDNRLFAGIESFQREQRLTVDGYMRPGGATEEVLNKAIAERPRPDPKIERQEAVIAFAKKYGMAEDKAREYMTKPSIFKTSGQRFVKAAPQVAENGQQQSQPSQMQPQTPSRAPSAAPLPPPSPPFASSAVSNPEVKPLRERVRERADSRRPTMPDAFINSLGDDDFMEGIPDIKRDIVKRNMNDWRQAQIERWKTGTPLTTDYALRTTLGFEGVMKATKSEDKNQGRPRAGGITDGTLKLFQAYAKQSDAEHNNNPIKIAARNRLRQELIDNRQAAAAFLDTLYRAMADPMARARPATGHQSPAVQYRQERWHPG